MTECSFCNKTSSQVKQMIAGPDVFICNECIDICSDTIHKSIKNSSAAPSFKIMEQTMYCALLQNYTDHAIKEMTQWIDDNITESWIRVYDEADRTEPTYKIFFNSESDLIAFKLRWI